MTPQRMTVRHATKGGHVHVGVWLAPIGTPNGNAPKVGDLIVDPEQWNTLAAGLFTTARDRYVEVTIIDEDHTARDDLAAGGLDGA